MSHESFPVALKSTIDYYAKQVADSKGLPFLDLASGEFDTAIVESDQPAICWDLASIDESPFDPMYSGSFEIGAMTLLDPSQYISLDITGAISSLFRVGSRFEIKDYSGVEIPDSVEGVFTVTSCGLAPIQQDQATNVRFVSVHIKAIRYG